MGRSCNRDSRTEKQNGVPKAVLRSLSKQGNLQLCIEYLSNTGCTGNGTPGKCFSAKRAHFRPKKLPANVKTTLTRPLGVSLLNLLTFDSPGSQRTQCVHRLQTIIAINLAKAAETIGIPVPWSTEPPGDDVVDIAVHKLQSYGYPISFVWYGVRLRTTGGPTRTCTRYLIRPLLI
ncbi:hypothetical protein GQ600_10900 [Phytophthora cactorum]|nr:hypothetical protein GQ600_10900 [Phytophthora cactorum]